MPQSVYQVPPGGVATVNAARLLMSPGLGCGNCRPGPHCARCRQRKMSGYSRANPIYTLRGLGAPSRPNNAVNRGMYRLPYYSAIPLPTLPNVAQALAGFSGRPRRKRKMRGLGDVPPGSTLTWSGGVVYTFGALTLADLVSAIQPILAAEGISIAGSNGPNVAASFLSTSPLPTTLVLQNSNDYGAPADIAAQVNNAIYQATGNMPASPSIAVTLSPGPGGAPANVNPPAPAQSASDWLSSNWPWLALGAAGVYIAKDFI
jgi:hypothetical protein